MNNGFKAKTNVLFLFLFTLLFSGTITATFPSSLSFLKEVHAALSEYEKDNVKCINFNLNVNGLNVNSIPESISGLLPDQANAEEAEESQIGGTDIIGTSAYGNSEKRFDSYYDDVNNKKNFAFVCINNNDNEQIIIPPPPTEDFFDLATANFVSNDVSILLGGAGGAFTLAAGSPIPVGANTPVSVAVGDFNGDGDLDISNS